MPVLDLSAYKPVPGTLEDANQIANGFQALQTCINGLDNNNFAAGKIFDPLKLMQDGAAAGQGLIWSAAANGGTGGWVPANVSPGLYRKTTSKQVVNSVAETDLLNGEITIGANAIGPSGVLRLTVSGDWKQNSGAGADSPRFKLKLGATTIFDTASFGSGWVPNAAARYGWSFVIEIANLGAANAQWATMSGSLDVGFVAVGGGNAFATGEGSYGVRLINSTTASGVEYRGVNAAAVDTTLAQALALTATLGVANAACDITLKNALVEVV